MRNRIVLLLLSLSLSCALSAQSSGKESLEQRAAAEEKLGHVANARSLYVKAFDDYISKSKTSQGVDCGIKAIALYYKESMYKEAFEMLRRTDVAIETQAKGADKAALRYLTSRERFQMYMRMRKSSNVSEQLNNMEHYANAAGNEELKNDLLYHKTVYYYSFGQNEKGNAAFKEMAQRLTAQKEYDKVDDVYQTLITNGRRSNNANLVAQAYNSYILWKDSVAALKVADQIAGLNSQIAADKASIAEKDSSLSSRKTVIIGLIVLALALAAVLVLGAVVLMRYIVLTRKQKQTIGELRQNNALKASFIANISDQLAPTLQKLDSSIPEVKALQNFTRHVQTLSRLETSGEEVIEREDTSVQPFCEQLMDAIRDKVRENVVLTVNAPKLSASINKEYVSRILGYLLRSAAFHTPAGEHITLEYKKRSAQTFQFLVSSTGNFIPEEERDNLFTPFVKVHHLTTGDGLGLPICRQMAMKMGGTLTIDPAFTKGTRFVLDLKSADKKNSLY